MFPDAVNLQKLSTSVPTVSVSRPVARRLKPQTPASRSGSQTENTTHIIVGVVVGLDGLNP